MKWANLLPLLAVVVLGIGYVRWLRPRIRQSRHDRWERAGLLPEQTGEDAGRPERRADGGDRHDDPA